MQSLYSKSTCSIKIGKSQTRSFNTQEVYAKVNFELIAIYNDYINDLPFRFQNTLSVPFVLPNGTKLNSLIYKCINYHDQKQDCKVVSIRCLHIVDRGC